MGQFTLKSSSSWRLSFSLPSWPSLPQFLLKTPLRLLLPRQNSPQPLLLLKLVNMLLLPLFKALPLTWLIYPRLLRLRLLTQLSLMPTLLALSHSPLPLFSPEFNLLMLSNPLSLPPLLPLCPPLWCLRCLPCLRPCCLCWCLCWLPLCWCLRTPRLCLRWIPLCPPRGSCQSRIKSKKPKKSLKKRKKYHAKYKATSEY